MNGLARTVVSAFGPAALLALTVVTPRTAAAGEARFVRSGPLVSEAVDWLSAARDTLAYGSGNRVRVGPASGEGALALDLDRAVIDGVLADRILILSDENRQLHLLDLAIPGSTPALQSLHPTPAGTMRLAQMDDYLAVAEDGYGLRILGLPVAPNGHHHHGNQGGGLFAVGRLPLQGAFAAVAVEARTVYLAMRGQGIAVVDATRPEDPVLVRVLPPVGKVLDLAVNGSTLYVLRPDGLVLVDPTGGAGKAPQVFSELRGRALHVAGRELWLASPGEGLRSYSDGAATAATFAVAVGNNFFNPLELTVNVGDSVEWTKAGSGFHNVFSCTAEQSGCKGVAATESFTSGAPTSDPFSSLHTFAQTGSDPYVCQIHFMIPSMQGKITVKGAPCENGKDPKASGYYRRMCIPGLPAQPDPLSAADVDCVNDSCDFASIATVDDLCAVLDPPQPINRCQRAEREHLTLLLNACREHVCKSDEIRSSCEGHTTVGESMARADELLCKKAPTPAECTRASCLAREINTGRAFVSD